ncbi:MAG: diguanylate cyclase [Sphaerochaeta sp.]|uniref:GGDEF domain-containing protein n=1 Tax=Sphaerochaeta sp. TaxID=1972642 RepID=UPI0029739046|nr:diguanylate cyclase [Sphaerochaeta sp.]
MKPTLELDMFSVVLMLFAIILAYRSVSTNPRNRWYILSCLSLMLLLGTELFAYQVDDVGVASQIFFHRFTNVLGFSLSPVVCYFLLHFIGYSYYRKRSRLLLLPMILNAALSALSYQTGWLFYVDPVNVYSRGPIYFVSALITLFYYALCIIHLIKTLKRYEASDRPLLLFILIIPLFGFAAQMLWPWVLTLWPGIALSLLLFYLFFQEQRYSIDALTGLRNRSIFMRDLSNLQHSCKGPATVVVLDVNDLKKTNDTEGHRSGDELLVIASGLVERCFRSMGKVYRVGGDEFAIISVNTLSDSIENALSLLSLQIELANKTRTIPLSLAIGSASCESCIGNIFNTYVASDNAMYLNKKAMKGEAGRG